MALAAVLLTLPIFVGHGRVAGALQPLPVPVQVYADPAGHVDDPEGIFAGPDGNLWFTSAGSDRIGRITPSGGITTFADPGGNVDGPQRITVGPDGALWFTSFDNDRIGRITTTGDISTFVDPAGNVDGPHGITVGPDGALWFTSSVNNRIGQITTDGTVTTFVGPDGKIRRPWGITTGVDGNLWFTNAQSGGAAVGRMTPAGQVTMFPSLNTIVGREITTGPDGNVWFAGSSNFSVVEIWRVTTSGVITRFLVQDNGFPGTTGLAVGPDANLWFTEPIEHDLVGRLTPTGVMTTFSDELGNGDTGVLVDTPTAITAGPDGAMWFTSSGNDRIGRLGLGTPLAGQVTGPSATVGGVWALAVATDGSAVRGARTSSAESVLDGRYEMFLDPGSYVVEFVDPTGGHGGEWHNDQPLSHLDQATPVVVNGGGATVNASLAPAGRTGAVAGTLTASGGGAASGVWVATFDLGAGRVAGGTVTAANGTYRIDGLSAGSYLVVNADPNAVRASGVLNGSAPVAVSAGATSTVDAVLAAAPAKPPPIGSLSGTVTSEGSPLSGVWVAAVDVNTGRFAGGTLTSGSGSYSLAVPAGNYAVEFVDPTGAHGAEWNHDHPVTGLAEADVVTVGSGQTMTVDAELAPDGPTGSIAGTVTETGTGLPVPGAWVAALSAADGSLAAGTEASFDGTYAITGLEAGSYKVVFIDPTGRHHVEFYDNFASFPAATPVAVAAGHPTTADSDLGVTS